MKKDNHSTWTAATARKNLKGYASKIPGIDLAKVDEFLGGGTEGYVFSYAGKALKVTNDPRCSWSNVKSYLRYFQKKPHKHVVKIHSFGKINSSTWWQIMEKLTRLDEEEEMELNNDLDNLFYFSWPKTKTKTLIAKLPIEYDFDKKKKEFLRGIMNLPFEYGDLVGFNVMKAENWKIVDLEGFTE